ncbi:MAG: glycoside hydrolase family 16 protein [Alphaproteobacteria bacterium]|nr:glycoside hydrolase family 16 protein [Alphaproteobacteria bacterium]MBV9692148.1 glycoside hydrolase family 16 protein [Alphaproteobacteria bacterium]
MALAATVFAAGASASPGVLARAPDGRPLTLTFFDEFDSFRPLGTAGGIWRTTFGPGDEKGLDRRTLPNNGELELYVDRRLADSQGAIGLDPFHAHGGVLEIWATPTPPQLLARLDRHPYVSGVITTQPSFSQTYGYFEMRAKLPSGKGLWPAFWLLPADQSWPPEIDVMECVSDPTTVHSTVHSNLSTAQDIVAQTAPDQFHVYAVAWDSKHVAFFVDNRKSGEVETPPDLNKPMYMLANLAVGGTWPGDPDAATPFPAKMTIDYIHAYRFGHV